MPTACLFTSKYKAAPPRAEPEASAKWQTMHGNLQRLEPE
jgi:hypothetical protein